MLNPALVDLKVYRTGTFDTKIILWKNVAETEPFLLSEYVVSIPIENLLTLSAGSGLTIASNEIKVQLTPAQTEALTSGSRAHYSLKLVKGAEVVFPIHGTMSFITP